MTRHTLLSILLTIVTATVAAPCPLHAASITVTTTNDELNSDGDCSLREAVRAANTNAAVDACTAGQNDQTDTITVPAGTYTLTLAGYDNDAAGGDLDLRNNTAVDDLVITGAGAATTIIQACTVSQLAGDCPAGQGVADRVLHVFDSHVAISGVTIRHGRAPNESGLRFGSGILLTRLSDSGAALTLTDAVVTKNGDEVAAVSSEAGGIGSWNAALTLTRVIVSDNVALQGSGISSGYTHAELVMTDSTVSGNVGIGAVRVLAPAVATLTNCTISNNQGVGFVTQGTSTLTNCTISGNQSTGGAGGISALGTLNLRNCTVTANRLLGPASSQGAGGLNASGAIVLRNTIVAGNFNDAPHPSLNRADCYGYESSPASEGFNLVGDGSKCPSLINGQNGDQIGTTAAPIDPKLDLLADYGGPTLTHPPLSDSPAVDAANPAAPGSGGTACPTTDQRGETRPSGIACDAGAVEAGGAVALAVDSVQPTVGGNAGTVELRVFGAGFVDGTVVKLVRAGFPDVVGTTAEVHGSPLTSALDLRGAAPGLWSVRVENPDASVVTLTDAFTIEAGGGADLWSQLVLPRAFNAGRTQTIYLQFGNRGTVDARAVPLFLSFSDELIWGAPFPVSPPPAQAGQQATDWTRIAIDVPLPRPAGRDQLLFLLPIVPASSTGTLRFRVKVPLGIDPSRVPIAVSGSIGASYFHPDLGAEVVAEHVARAKVYAATAHGTTTFPSDAAIEQYVRTQLTTLVAEGTAKRAEVPGGDPPVYSLTQLLVDTGQFIAGESATASSPLSVHRWLAELADFVTGRPAFARLRVGNPDPNGPASDCALFGWCEDLKPPCELNPELCESCETNPDLCDPPVKPINCDYVSQFSDEYLFGPCKPKDDYVPYVFSFDPNDKVGPGGLGGFIDGVTPLPYTILFENKPTAAGDAFEVTVTDQLDTAKYDLATFQLGSISFGDKFVPVPPRLQSFSTEVDLRPGANIAVGIEAALDTATGIVRWKFTTLDPETHEFPENPDEGFLPPNVTSPEGEGAVLFTVSLKHGFGLGTTVCNDARIVFDFNAPIDTPNFCNTIGAPEDCENCIDDDGDALVDRADPDCAAPANGAGAGVGDATVGKAVDKCAKAIRKVGAKLTSTRLKQLGACEKAVADCVQLKNGDDACLTKAQAKCTKAKNALPTAEAKLTAGIVKACGEPAVTAANLTAAAGLGFDGETVACAGRGVAALATVADVAECVTRQHRCAAGRLLGAVVPRARELLALGGFGPTDLVCLDGGANGAGSAIAAAKRKALRKCDAAIQKAATKLVAGRAKAREACGAAVFTCLQTKPGDPACVGKAGGTCAKAVAGIPKLESAFATTIAKSCGASPLVATDLSTAEGLGASALAERCAKLGIASLATVADVTACLRAQLTCDVDHLLESTTPRLGELLGLGGVTLP